MGGIPKYQCFANIENIIDSNNHVRNGTLGWSLSGIFGIQLFTPEKVLGPRFHAEIPEGCLSKKVSTLLLHTGHLLDIQESINGFKNFFS